jgi:hypothetical protein
VHECIESKDVIEVAEGMMQPKTNNKHPKQPAFQCNSKWNRPVFTRPQWKDRDYDQVCMCSCFAWGQEFWDD